MTNLSTLRLVPMTPRDPGEKGRTASTLELFFDLVFVVAVSTASTELYQVLSTGNVIQGLLNYAIVFFGIWWAWMNFTWFATSFDTDDWLYRLMTFAQMGGVLGLSAGIKPAFESHNYKALVFAYVLMRMVMVAQWIRASISAGPSRRATRIYAAGITLVQISWVCALMIPGHWFYAAMILHILAELAVPIIAERLGSTPWHPQHITERYGLFTLIVLGESLLGSSNAIISALHDTDDLWPLIGLAAMALIVTASMWWLYFWPPHSDAISSFASSLAYGYGHYFVLGAAGAFSVGIRLQIDVLSGSGAAVQRWASFAHAVPLSVFILGVWALAVYRHADRVTNTVVVLAGLVVLLDPLSPVQFVLPVVALVATVTVLVWRPPIAQAVKKSSD